MPTTVPRRWSDLTPAWMTTALERDFPGVAVAHLEVGDTEEGTNRRARVRLSYSAGTGPETVFVKMPGRPLHRLALAALGASGTEAFLAASDLQLPLEHPHLYGGAVDQVRMSAVVVMEDVTDRAGRPNQATMALTPEQVRFGLDGLARLHASLWGRPRPPELAFLRPWRLSRAWAPLSTASLANGVRRLRRSGQSSLVSVDVRVLERQFRASAGLAATGPQTLLHGDPHLGNTYSVGRDQTGFFDWQLARIGSWSHDVGYFMVGSLSVEDRRAHQDHLLTGYLDTLHRLGVDAPAFDAAWARYCASPAFGLATWLHVISAGTFQSREAALATLERFAAAYDELGTRRWLGTGGDGDLRWWGK
ncbi:MAG: phosphotransferase [Acidimicrobiales bacterium]|nr:phosphotransferase [Acidimicrobiales bacterium]